MESGCTNFCSCGLHIEGCTPSLADGLPSESIDYVRPTIPNFGDRIQCDVVEVNL